MAGSRDHYQRLGVKPEASGAEIRAAFLARAREQHPDRALPEVRTEAETAFRQLTEAYETLADPVRRQDYDARRRMEQVWRPPAATTTAWRKVEAQVRESWGLERIPWYGWLVVSPVLLATGAVIAAQFFFYYVTVLGFVFAVPLIATWYAWQLWKPLALLVFLPTCWLWGFLIQGMWRNWKRERTGPDACGVPAVAVVAQPETTGI